jgi:tRNA U34 5-methylaminomethyl-2-thiouridine-forming methyltransferase MnmC
MAIILTDDGSHSVLSETYGVTYHSTHGAVTESAHVFIAAGLQHKALVQRKINILETGFGTGLNAFMSWLEAERANLEVQYTGLEIMPVSAEESAQMNYAGLLGVPERAADFQALHQCEWGEAHAFSESFHFRKEQISIETFEADHEFDVIYFDAFAPQAQPELWTADVFGRMYRALRPGGVLVTYCAQGAFKRTLKQAGFQVERLPGPPGKREMTRATKM